MSSFFGPRVGERIRSPEKLIGLVLCGDYPAHNFLYMRLRYEPRRVLIERFRDLRAEPLESETLEGEPDVRRSRYLIVGRDLDKGQERRFYLGSFRSWSLFRPTPTIIFPQLSYEIVDAEGVRQRFVSDSRFHVAVACMERNPTCVLVPACNGVMAG